MTGLVASASHLRLDKELPRWLEIETALLGGFLFFGFCCCFVLFFGVWLEEVFVKLKPWCIEGFAGAHSGRGWGLRMNLSLCVSM